MACGFIIAIWSVALVTRLHTSPVPPLGMHMGLGGNPYGPAGTGKTESVKALGGLFGRQVLVFNCDEVHVGRVIVDHYNW